MRTVVLGRRSLGGRLLQHVDFGRGCAAVFEVDTGPEALEGGLRHPPAHLYHVLLLDVIARMEETAGEVAVVGEKEKHPCCSGRVFRRGTPCPRAGTLSTTVGRPRASDAALRTPRGLLSSQYSFVLGLHGPTVDLYRLDIGVDGDTQVAAVSPSMVTRPASINSSHLRRDPRPASARILLQPHLRPVRSLRPPSRPKPAAQLLLLLLAEREALQIGQILQTRQAEHGLEAGRRPVEDRSPSRSVRGPTSVMSSRSDSVRRGESEFTPRISPICGRDTGCRYAMMASTSIAAGERRLASSGSSNRASIGGPAAGIGAEGPAARQLHELDAALAPRRKVGRQGGQGLVE